MNPTDLSFGTAIGTATRTVVASVLIVPAFLLFTGCTTQHISRTAGDQAAENGASSGRATIVAHGCHLSQVNGESVSSLSSGADVPSGPVVAIFEVDPSDFLLPDRSSMVQTIRFNAEAGVTYIVTGRRGDGRLCAFPKQEDGQPDLVHPAGCITRD